MTGFTKKFICTATLMLAGTVHAETRIITAPSCLIAASKVRAEVITWSDNMYLLKIDDKSIEVLSDAKHNTKTPCGGFMDVTAEWNRAHHASSTIDDKAFLASFTNRPHQKHRENATYNIRYQTQVQQLMKRLNPQRMWDSLVKFSSSDDRYANSADGVAAANWIKTQIEAAAQSAGRSDVSVFLIKTPGYKQPSVVAKLGSSHDAGVVVGAHMDTNSQMWGKMPGADDDGSGSMTVMEAARTVIESGTTFNKPVYFIWYSAEELGLLGSQSVVAYFQKNQIPVAGVMHFDMTGFAYRNEPTIWLMKDNVDSDLTNFVEKIITTYTGQAVKYTRCGYACSDHASWDKKGYPAVLPAEARFEDTNPVMHSSQDTIDKLSITHMTDYAKIATAFAVELAEPTA